MDSLTHTLLEGLYRQVRRMLGDAAFDEGGLRLRGASSDELEHLRGRLGALRDVLDVFDTVIADPAAARERILARMLDRL
jgi:hypothetical protein